MSTRHKSLIVCATWCNHGNSILGSGNNILFQVTGVSECWEFYAVPTVRVISQQKQVWTYSVPEENKFGLFQSWVIESMR